MDKPLKTIFHIDEQEYKKVYEKRFSAPYTEHFDFNVNSRYSFKKIFTVYQFTV